MDTHTYSKQVTADTFHFTRMTWSWRLLNITGRFLKQIGERGTKTGGRMVVELLWEASGKKLSGYALYYTIVLVRHVNWEIISLN